MENVQALMGALFNAALVVMIVATMFNAGLSTTTKALGGVLKNVWLVILTLIVAFILRPLVGYGLAALFSLSAASFSVHAEDAAGISDPKSTLTLNHGIHINRHPHTLDRRCRTG